MGHCARSLPRTSVHNPYFLIYNSVQTLPSNWSLDDTFIYQFFPMYWHTIMIKQYTDKQGVPCISDREEVLKSEPCVRFINNPPVFHGIYNLLVCKFMRVIHTSACVGHKGGKKWLKLCQRNWFQYSFLPGIFFFSWIPYSQSRYLSIKINSDDNKSI